MKEGDEGGESNFRRSAKPEISHMKTIQVQFRVLSLKTKRQKGGNGTQAGSGKSVY